MITTALGHWNVEARDGGLFVLVEEIGGQGELGPFPDLETAKRGLVAYLSGDDGHAGSRSNAHRNHAERLVGDRRSGDDGSWPERPLEPQA